MHSPDRARIVGNNSSDDFACSHSLLALPIVCPSSSHTRPAKPESFLLFLFLFFAPLAVGVSVYIFIFIDIFCSFSVSLVASVFHPPSNDH